MLIVYPFAFLTGAFGFSVAAAASRDRERATARRSVADHLVPAGIGAGLVAAVPGLIDYLTTVPPRSSASQRAATHGLLNTAALGLFAASWLARRQGRHHSTALALQGLGTLAMSIAGYMGGTLVYRNQIGVDHRYANAGKWREESVGEAPESSQALLRTASGLEVDQMKLVHAGGERVVVARTETGVTAFSDRCTHRGGPLSDGTLICGTVQCPWHGSQFDVHSGAVKCGPATAPIETRLLDETSQPQHA
jgi:nitrite reductase/ring-hydroxylating ferredoxin subunit/uncharacterized membrane protein